MTLRGARRGRSNETLLEHAGPLPALGPSGGGLPDEQSMEGPRPQSSTISTVTVTGGRSFWGTVSLSGPTGKGGGIRTVVSRGTTAMVHA